MSIWTSTKSQYGTCSSNTKPISKSTAYRWMKKDNRTKSRKSKTLKIDDSYNNPLSGFKFGC